MTTLNFPSQAVRETWIDPFDNGEDIRAHSGFRLAIDARDEVEYPVQILATTTAVSVLVSPETVGLPGVAVAATEEGLRAALSAAGIAMNGADNLFFLPQGQKARLAAAANDDNVRRLTSEDGAAFAVFAAAAPAEDFAEAFVALDHWAVFGAFDGNRLVSVGSAFPFGGSATVADLGVVTLPAARGKGRAKSVIEALVRHALSEGFEPQYRCQLDNTSSVILAGKSGFERLGTWDVSARSDGTSAERSTP